MAPVGLRQDVGKATANIIELFCPPVHLFPCADDAFKNLVQLARSGKIRAVEVDMEHRIFRPLRLQPFHRQSLEQIPLSLEIAFQGGDQQAFPKAARTAQKVYLAVLDQIVDQRRLVDINVTILYQLVETLDSYRIFHHGALILTPTKKQFYFETGKFSGRFIRLADGYFPESRTTGRRKRLFPDKKNGNEVHPSRRIEPYRRWHGQTNRDCEHPQRDETSPSSPAAALRSAELYLPQSTRVLAAEYAVGLRTALRRNEACHGLESAAMKPDMPLRPAVS